MMNRKLSDGAHSICLRVTMAASPTRSVVVIGTGAERDPADAMKWVACPGSNALHTFHLDHVTGTLSLASKVPCDAGTNPM